MLAALVVATACSGGHGRTLQGQAVSITIPNGWYGVYDPGRLQAADFPLRHDVLLSAERARVPRGHIHVIVWDSGPAAELAGRGPAPVRLPLMLRPRDVTSAPLEGFPLRDAFAIRNVKLDGELLNVAVDFGPKPLSPASFAEANRVLATLRVHPSRILHPHGRMLARDGVSLRLLPGWAGRIEVPAATFAAKQIFLARRGRVRVVLAEVPATYPVRQRRLPVSAARLTSHFAGSVFMVNGHSFQLSSTFAELGGLAAVNRLVSTLRVAPKRWRFSECEFSLSVPGPWIAGVRHRGGCYLVLTLRARGLRVVLVELRPKERAAGQILRRASRRFQVEVRPASAASQAGPVLATLKAKPRSALSR